MSGSGREIIEKALLELKENVSSDDARTFETTSLQDVWHLAREMEREQTERGRSQYMRRLEHVLRSLESYSGVLDTFCQGFSPMAWVWGPIKLFLMLARQHFSVLEKILEAYKSIEEHLPRIDKLQAAFGEDENFQKVLGFIFKDIAEFHQRAYRFLRRRGWAVLFAFDWGLFERRFKSLLDSIAFRFELVDREAAAINFGDMKKARDLDRLEYEKEEKQRQSLMFQAVRSWLSAAEDSQEEFLENLSSKRQPGTCNWILEQDPLKGWIKPTEADPLVWLTGKPGGGKSILASFLVHHLQSRHETTVLYFFCDLNSDEVTCAEVLRTMAFQALQQNPDLASLVHQAYLQKVSTRSAPKIKSMLKEIFTAVKSVHIVVDGVDQCTRTTQQKILEALSDIQKSSTDIIKILVSSRLEGQISEPLPTKVHFSLNGQTDGAIQLFVALKLKEIKDSFPEISEVLLGRIENRMLDKAQGMFLWVYLVTAMLKDQASEIDLERSVEQLPDGLDAVYGRILKRLGGLSESVRSRAYKVLSWLCAASRDVKVQEVADGVILQPGQMITLNKKTRIHNTQRNIVDICAPLVEKSPRGYLEIVHFSAKEFLVHVQSGPFIEIAQAHFDVGYSCLSSLLTSFVVLQRFSPNTTEQELDNLMLEGYFGLHSYAHEYWAYHVSQYFQKIGTLEKAVPPSYDAKILIKILGDFTRVWKGNLGFDNVGLSDHSSGPDMGSIQTPPHLLALIKEWMNFRSSQNEVETSTATIEAQIEAQLRQDPTYLSLIAQQVRSIKENLMRLDPTKLPTHINEEDFRRFRSELGEERFKCRYGHCNHFSSTFEERREHEVSHNPYFPCPHCDFSGKGFRCRRDLERHIKQYHLSGEDANGPESLTSIFERGQSSINAPSVLHYGLPSSLESGSWNEKGRKALQSTFRQVYKAMALDEPVSMDEPSDGQNGPVSGTTACSIFASIGRKIDAGQYQTLKDFTADINCIYRLQGSVGGPERIQNVFHSALQDAVNSFPGFTCTSSQDDFQPNFDHLVSTKLEESCNGDDLRIHLGGQPWSGHKPVFWSKMEDGELPSLLGTYGKDFSRIAEFLKTKTPNDVEERFNFLVRSGREDLAKLVSSAEARLVEEQDGDSAVLPEINRSDLSTISPDTGIMTDVEGSADGVSRLYSESPAHLLPEVADSVPSFPLSEITSTYPNHGYVNGPSTSRKQHRSQDVDEDSRPKKYRRQAPIPAYCHECKDGPKKLRDEHTLLKHIARFHSPVRKVWICIDVSIDKNMLANCRSCQSGTRYGSKNNAATHLRKKHFGATASMETLTRWMEEVAEPNPNHSRNRPDHDASVEKSEKLPSVSFWSSRDQDQASETDEEGVLKEIPLLEVSFDDILQGYGGITAPDGVSTPRPIPEREVDSSIPHLAHKGLIRADHVDRLPNLSGPRKAVTRDQVTAYYHILTESDIKSREYNKALEKLKGLSQRLLKDLRDWRRDLIAAPEIRPSF